MYCEAIIFCVPMKYDHGPGTTRAPCNAPDSESMAFVIKHLVFGNRSSDSAPAARPALILLPSDKAFIYCLTQSYHVWLSYLFTVSCGNCVKHLPSVTYVPYSVQNCLWAGERKPLSRQTEGSPEKRFGSLLSWRNRNSFNALANCFTSSGKIIQPSARGFLWCRGRHLQFSSKEVTQFPKVSFRLFV